MVCCEDCELLKIPSPHGRGEFKSGLHLNTFARTVRMLLVRINRTTVTTALFHLGLAEHFLPSYKPLDVPKQLVDLCQRADSKETVDASNLLTSENVTPLVRKCMAGLYGFADDMDVDVTVEVSAARLRPAVPSTPVRRGVPPCPLKVAMEGVACKALPDPVRSSDNLTKIGESSSRGSSRSNLAAVDDFPVPQVTRSLSFDSTFKSNIDVAKLAGHRFLLIPKLFIILMPCVYFADEQRTKDPGMQQRSIQTRLFRLDRGQSIIDADVVPGLYIIVQGEMTQKYTGKYNQKAGMPLIGRWKDEEISLKISNGCILGHVAMFSGNSSDWYGTKGSKTDPVMSVTVSSQSCWLIGVSINSYLRELISRPSVIFHVSNRLISALPPLLKLFDFCTKWKKVNSGENIVTKGAAPTGELQVLLFGRLGVITVDAGGGRIQPNASSDILWTSPTGKPMGRIDTTDEQDDGKSFSAAVDSNGNAIEPEFVLGKGALIGNEILVCSHLCF